MVGHRDPERSASIKVKMRVAKQTLVFIPILFILLRMWCTLQYFYVVYLANNAENNDWCIPVGLKDGHFVLGILQVIRVVNNLYLNFNGFEFYPRVDRFYKGMAQTLHIHVHNICINNSF